MTGDGGRILELPLDQVGQTCRSAPYDASKRSDAGSRRVQNVASLVLEKAGRRGSAALPWWYFQDAPETFFLSSELFPAGAV